MAALGLGWLQEPQHMGSVSLQLTGLVAPWHGDLLGPGTEPLSPVGADS